jgi:hypothetical protein
LRQDRPPTACRRDGFRFSFTPLAGVLFAFPSRYWFTIGRQGIFSLGGWSPQLPTGLLGPRGTRVRGSGSRLHLRLPGSHRLWRPLPRHFDWQVDWSLPGLHPIRAPQPRASCPARFGLLPVRSPLLGESRLVSFPRGTEMFQFPRFASRPYGFSAGYVGMTPRGFPHSGIHGSQPACGSPWLFAACHALHRFLAPRHPPSALSCLTTVPS